jgi:hypothetical protein
MRFVRYNLRDHVASQKNDHGPLYWRYGTSKRQSCPKISICEIFGIVDFRLSQQYRREAAGREAAGGGVHGGGAL